MTYGCRRHSGHPAPCLYWWNTFEQSLSKQKSKLLFTSRLGNVPGKQTNVLFLNGVGKLYDIRVKNKHSYLSCCQLIADVIRSLVQLWGQIAYAWLRCSLLRQMATAGWHLAIKLNILAFPAFHSSRQLKGGQGPQRRKSRATYRGLSGMWQHCLE